MDKFDEKLKEIGFKVKALRQKKIRNYEDFAKEVQLNKNTINRIENGENFTLKSLLIILDKLDIPMKEFFQTFD